MEKRKPSPTSFWIDSSHFEPLAQRAMTTQGFFEQVSGQIAATAPLGEGMALEIIHHPAGQGDVDALRTGRIRHRSRTGSCGLLLDPLLQLSHQVLKERHDFVKIISQYINVIVQDKIA